MKKIFKFGGMILLALLVYGAFAPVAQGQTPVPDYTLRFNRDFGYGGGSKVRGTFSLAVSGDLAQVARVVYFIDGQQLAEVSEAPFKYQFNTDNEGYGWKELTAVLTTTAGNQLSLGPLRYNFVSAEDEKADMTKILIPIGGVIVGVLLLSFLIQYLTKPKPVTDPDQPRDYGMLGGTICPKCGHPFPRSLMGVNLLTHRLERCESCKKFVMTTRATPEALYKAEQAEREAAQADAQNEINSAVSSVSTPERALDELDDSKYMDEV